MLHLPWIAAVSLLALGGAAAAAPAEPQQWTWVEGQLSQVDADREEVVVRHGRREMRFALDPRAEILDGARAVLMHDLRGDVGRAVFVRYCVTLTGPVADFLEVVDDGVAPAAPSRGLDSGAR